MEIVTQFSIFLINKPGILSQVLKAMADEKVNIRAMTMMDSVEHGVLRAVTAKPEHTRTILKRLSLQVSESEVLCVTLSNKPGAMADVAGKLSNAHISISYCYVTTGAKGGKTTGIFKVADLKKAMKILGKETNTTKESKSKKICRPANQIKRRR